MEKLLQIQMNSRFQGGSDTLKKRLDARYRLIYGEARLAYKQQIDPESPALTPEVLLVVDATTGQNAVMQAKEFKEASKITGLVLTKLDGTAKGGAVFSIKDEIDIPVKFIGVGEQIDDLQPFKPAAFADGLFDKIEYKEEEDITLEIFEESKEELEEVNEDILQEELSLEDLGNDEETSETDDTGLEQEEEIEEQAEEEQPEKKEA